MANKLTHEQLISALNEMGVQYDPSLPYAELYTVYKTAKEEKAEPQKPEELGENGTENNTSELPDGSVTPTENTEPPKPQPPEETTPKKSPPETTKKNQPPTAKKKKVEVITNVTHNGEKFEKGTILDLEDSKAAEELLKVGLAKLV